MVAILGGRIIVQAWAMIGTALAALSRPSKTRAVTAALMGCGCGDYSITRASFFGRGVSSMGGAYAAQQTENALIFYRQIKTPQVDAPVGFSGRSWDFVRESHVLF
jgi:hypothetical protein